MEQTELKEIVSKFAIKGTVAEIKPLGAGLINDTFMVTTSEEDQPASTMLFSRMWKCWQTTFRP